MIEDDPYEVERFQRYFDKQNDLELIATTDSATQGLDLINANRPDGIILDLELSEGNGILFISGLQKLNLDYRPYILVTTWTTEPATIKSLRANQVAILSKTTIGYDADGPSIVAEMLREVCPYISAARVEPVPRQEKGQEERESRQLTRTFLNLSRIGMPAGKKSISYLVNAIVVAANHPFCSDGSVDMANAVYPALEKLFSVNWKTLEKAMRSRIASTWDNVPPEILQKEYTQYIDPEKGKPELKDFIAYYANQIR